MENEVIIETIKSGKSLFDFVANEGYKMSKEQLVAIIKELDYLIWEYFGSSSDSIEYKTLMNNLADNLVDWFIN